MELPKPIAVALGGILGTALRWAVLDAAGGAGWALVLVNTVGSLLLGAVVHGILHRRGDLRLLLAVGFCGSLTTFSTLALELALRLDEGRILDAVGLGVVSLACGLTAALVGGATRKWATR